MTNLQRGAEWRKWDLHVHTPSSICQCFGSNDDETWNKYLTEIENLPEEFAVLGINDYLFLDGYEKLLDEQKNNNRIANVILFPVIEFRIEKFAGICFEKLKRINLHVIFSNELSIETIKSQFLNTLEQSYMLETGVPWDRAITLTSVTELGASIKSSVPPSELVKYGSDLEEGFNNLNVKEDQIFHSLKKDCFKGKYLIAIGKTEWDELKWSDSSIASKKTIINRADLIFTASEDITKFNRAKKRLKEQAVNDLLLDCSDAHYYSNSTEKDRIGNCLTWIKADPTFDGLMQVLNEPEERVYVGEKPEIFNRVSKNRTKYIKELTIKSIDGYDYKFGKWFHNVSIPLNKELIAVIGHKGSGKSAIADILSLCANYHNNDDFSFLNAKKFCEKNGRIANNFIATLMWENGYENSKGLNINVENSLSKRVKYLPQGQFERLTNEISSVTEFQREIEKVVFSHIEEAAKLGTLSFEELLNKKKSIIETEVKSLNSEIESLNLQIIKLEHKKTPAYIIEIENMLKQREDELKALIEPEIVSNPNDDPEKKRHSEVIITVINNLQNELDVLELELKVKQKEKGEITINLKTLYDVKKEIELKVLDLMKFISSKKEVLASFQLSIEQIVSINIDFLQLENVILELEKKLKTIDALLIVSDSNTESKTLPMQIDEKQNQIQNEKNKLDSEQKKYQDFLASKKIWDDEQKKIIGSAETFNTIKFYEKELEFIAKELNHRLTELYDNRNKYVRNIFKLKQEVIAIYKETKSRLNTIIDSNSDILKDYKIDIDAALVKNTKFNNDFFNFINHSKAGTYHSIEGADKKLNEFASVVNFDDEDSVVDFLDTILDSLRYDKRDKQNNTERVIEDQVSNILPLYKYLFSLDFIDYNFQLKQNNKGLDQLSPGERGALLLVFYLLLDKNDIPLIIDQPEDNLDNHSVAKILVPFIRSAKSKRQIIMVTHNPNLAVVADAEQIIFVNLDKEKNYEFSVVSGSIEDREVNKKIVEVLEGAMPAFNKRRDKYFE